MESLFQLVADSFARHGIESPAPEPPVSQVHPAEQPLSTELPDHNYRKKKEAP